MTSQVSPKVLYGVLAVLVVAIGAGVFFSLSNRETTTTLSPTATPSAAVTATPATQASARTFTFRQTKKAAHFETSTPAHEAILASVPVNIVIDFNFDLHASSEISIKSDGKEYGQGATTVDTSKLTLRRAVNPAAPDGLYVVSYKACWPDKSCHDGEFSFAIDRTRATSYTDATNQKEVTIRMTDILFKPMDIRVSKGTKVTWVNDDTVTHFVNTDSHPAHTYHLAHNSRGLEKGQSYSYTFDTAGAYPYHCSAHADTMVGTIIVE